ncbi:LysE family translocator [Streptomyces sp. NPDC054887]
MSVNLVGFLGVVLLAYVVPGPDFLVIVRAAARRRSLGWAAASGAQAGLCVHMAAAALGLSVLAAQSAVAFTVIKLAGAAYLVFLGVRAFRAAGRVARGSGRASGLEASGQQGARNASFGTKAGSFVEGFLTNVLNPKAALFFLSVLPQFVDDGGSSMTAQILLLGVLDVFIGVLYWPLVVVVAAKLRGLLARPVFRRRWERTTGVLFVGTGAGVAAS